MHYALYKEGICSTAKKEVSRGINWVWDQRRKKSSLITNLNYNARDLKPQNLFYSCGVKCRPKKKETHIGSKSFFRFHPQRKRWRKGNNWIILHRLLSRLLYHQKNVGRIFVYLSLRCNFYRSILDSLKSCQFCPIFQFWPFVSPD